MDLATDDKTRVVSEHNQWHIIRWVSDDGRQCYAVEHRNREVGSLECLSDMGVYEDDCGFEFPVPRDVLRWMDEFKNSEEYE